jgi:hypothetical protein
MISEKYGKEATMFKKIFNRKWIFLLLLFLLFLPLSNVEGKKKKMELVGKEVPNFTLPSTHDRMIHYAEEYYGKHYLIITFFPAAFTPI